MIKYTNLKNIMKTFDQTRYKEVINFLDQMRYHPMDMLSESNTNIINIFGTFKRVCLDFKLTVSANAMQEVIDTYIFKNIDQNRSVYLGEHVATILDSEMNAMKFFSIEADKQFLLSDKNLFGEEVTLAFPSVAADIEEAGKCMAFERWTAAVFHLGRVAEIATVAIGKLVGYKNPKEGFGNVLLYMGNKLEQVNKDYKHADNRFKGSFVFLSGVNAQMNAVNNAWRKQVAHMENKYNEEEAGNIWTATKALMQQLVKELRENTR